MALAVKNSILVPGALGAFATKAVLAAGDEIARETPLLVSPPYTAATGPRYNDRFAWAMVEQILAKGKDQVKNIMRLLLERDYATGGTAHNWEPADDAVLERLVGEFAAPLGLSSDVVRYLYAIIGTNVLTAARTVIRVPSPMGIGSILVEGASHYAFYAIFSRVNHSCAPNARPQVPRSPTDPYLLVALRPIAEDEEITINYLGHQVVPNPRLALMQLYGFRCVCPRCRPLCGWLECSTVATHHCPCGRAHYCGREHQQKDWPRHKAKEHV